MSRSPFSMLTKHAGTFVIALAAGVVLTLGVRSMLVGDTPGAHAGHPPATMPPHHEEPGHEGHEHAPPEAAPADPHAGHEADAREDATDTSGVLLSLGNADCPVMGAAAKDTVFTDWNGLRVLHCCPGCTETFLEDPETLLDDVSPGWREALETARAIDAASGSERERLLTDAAKRWKVLRRPEDR